LKKNWWDLSLNYNRILDDGRYLMPREWGRDPFYTYLPRERNEGSGDVHAIVLKGSGNFEKIHLKASLAGAYVQMPDVKNYAMNKYGVPSYAQVNADVQFNFDKFVEGLTAQILLVYKYGIGDVHNDQKYVINKVDMLNYNFVLNYCF
jgi:hypothetical protein